MAQSPAPIVPRLWRPRLWLLPGLSTAAALLFSWSLLPSAQRLWQREPVRPPHLVEAEAARLQRLLPGARSLRLPLSLPCPGGDLRGTLDAGAPLRLQEEGAALLIELPERLPEGPHRLLLQASGCDGTSPARHSHVQLLQLPQALPPPRLQVARGVEPGGVYAAVRGTPGAEAELLLDGGGPDEPQVIAALPLPGGGIAGVELPLPLERAQALRARQRVAAALDPEGAVAPSPPSPPPTVAPREQLLALPSPSAALWARLVVGARELRWSWDLTLPDSYLSAGGPLPPWRRLEGASPVSLRVGPGGGGFDDFDCQVRDATVERLPGATRLRGGCQLIAGETMRTLLFHSGARLHLQVAGDPELHLPATLEVAPGSGARLADAQPPPAPGARFALDTGEAGPYLRFLRRTVFPLVDMPEPAALLLQPARSIVEHASEVIGIVLRLLPLMVLLPALGERAPVAALLLLLLGGACGPLAWGGVSPSLTGNLPQLAAALLWELAALCWVAAAVRSRGLLRSLPKIALLLLGLALPLLWIYALGQRGAGPLGEVAGRGAFLSAGLGVALAGLLMALTAHLGRLAGLPRAGQLALLLLGVLVLVMDGVLPTGLQVDAVARRLARLAPVLSMLAAAALHRRGALTADDLLWPLFLAAVPPLYLDHGLPLGLLASLVVYRLWRTVLSPEAPAPAAAAAAAAADARDPVHPEVEAVLLAVGDHPMALLDAEREALEARARRGEVLPEAYALAKESLAAREAAAEAGGYQRDYRSLPAVLSAGTAAGPIADGVRALRLAVPPTVLYLVFLLLVKEPFDPGRLLVQLLGSLRQLIQLGAMCFFFGFAFGKLPGKNGLIKAMLVTLLTFACEVPAAVLTWYRPEDVGRGLVRWVGVLGILGWVGLGGFDLHRLQRARRGILDLARVRGYSRGFALTTSVILAIFTAVVSGVTGRVSALLTGAAFGSDSSAAAPLRPEDLPSRPPAELP